MHKKKLMAIGVGLSVFAMSFALASFSTNSELNDNLVANSLSQTLQKLKGGKQTVSKTATRGKVTVQNSSGVPSY